MEESEFIGKVNRFGSEYRVYLNQTENCIQITDEVGTELKCNAKKGKNNDSILEHVPKILQSVGL